MPTRIGLRTDTEFFEPTQALTASSFHHVCRQERRPGEETDPDL